MLYDIKAHLPQVIEGLRESSSKGDSNGFEASKIFAKKLLGDGFSKQIEMIDAEHLKRREKLNKELELLDRQQKELINKIGENEKDYLETILGETFRTIDNISPAQPVTELE